MKALLLVLLLLPSLVWAQGSVPTETPFPNGTPTTQPTPPLHFGGEEWTWEYQDGYGRISKWGNGPDYVRMVKVGHRHYRLTHNLDPRHSMLPEDGSLGAAPAEGTADVQYLDMDVNHFIGEISLYQGHCDSSSLLTQSHETYGADLCAQNRLGVNVVRSYFGPDFAPDDGGLLICGGVGGDCGRRIGPSARGAVPHLMSQQYEILMMLDRTQGVTGNRVVCLSTTNVTRGHICDFTGSTGTSDALTSVVGVANFQGSEGIGGLMYVTRFGIVTNVDCSGTIALGDRVRVSSSSSPGIVVADNDASASSTLGIALATCNGGLTSILLGSKGSGTQKLTLNAGTCFGARAILPTATPTPTSSPTPTGATPTAPSPTRTATPTVTPTSTPTPMPQTNPAWDAITTDGIPNPRCYAEGNTSKLVFDFDAALQCIQRDVVTPSDFARLGKATIFWFSSGTSTGTMPWVISLSCAADAQGHDQAFTSNVSMLDSGKSVANQLNTITATIPFPTVEFSRCTGTGLMRVRICRNTGGSFVGTASFLALELQLTR